MAGKEHGRAGVYKRPDAFEAALSGGAGWGLTFWDGMVMVLTGVAVLVLCCVLWFKYGVEGVPGLAVGDVAGEPVAIEGTLVEGEWDPAAPSVEVDGGSMGVSPAGDAQLFAVVQNSEGYREVLPLGSDAVFAVRGGLGTNVIEVQGGRVRCREADCSNQVCVNTGWVGASGQMIVCLPHELTVQVVRDPADAAALV